MADTVFSKILAGEIPCHRVYEDGQVLAFLDIGPVAPGHTLIIPKEPAETIDRLSEDSAAALGRVLPRIVRAVLGATGATACNILQNNGRAAFQSVDHVHFHVIPRTEGGQGLGIDWRPTRLDPEAGARLAAEISRRL